MLRHLLDKIPSKAVVHGLMTDMIQFRVTQNKIKTLKFLVTLESSLNLGGFSFLQETTILQLLARKVLHSHNTHLQRGARPNQTKTYEPCGKSAVFFNYACSHAQTKPALTGMFDESKLSL